MNTEMKDPHLAAIIKVERKRRNLTQEHLAQLAELDVRTIQRAERDGSCSSESLMAIAEALDCDAKDLIAEAEERRSKQQSQPRPPKDVVVRLEEITNGHELFATIKGAHAGIEDFDTSLDSWHLEEVALVFDYLRDFGDIQNDLMPSERIRFAEEVGEKIQALRSDGIICFVGDYNERLIFKHKPDEPLTWNVGVVVFRRANDGRILQEKNGKRFFVATIPGKNRTPF